MNLPLSFSRTRAACRHICVHSSSRSATHSCTRKRDIVIGERPCQRIEYDRTKSEVPTLRYRADAILVSPAFYTSRPSIKEAHSFSTTDSLRSSMYVRTCKQHSWLGNVEASLGVCQANFHGDFAVERFSAVVARQVGTRSKS